MGLTAINGQRKRKAKRAVSRRTSDKSLEPKWDGWEELTGEQYHRKRTWSHEWYYREFKSSDLYPFAFAWMEKNGYSKDDIKAAKAADHFIISSTAAILCRLLLQGMPDFNQKEDDYWQTCAGTTGKIRPASEWVKVRIAEAIEKGKTNLKERKVEESKKVNTRVLTIQERLQMAAMQMSNSIDDIVEKPVEEIDLKTFSPLNELKKVGAKPNHAKIIKNFYNGEMLELEEFLNPPSATARRSMTEQEIDWADQLQESYAIFTTDQIKKKHKVLKAVCDACDMVIAQGKLTRKPRKVKPKSAEKLVSKIKYNKSDEKLALVSINPADIIKAEELWTYNTKTRKLGHYVTSVFDPQKQKRDGTGLEVKGTTLIRFSENESIAKTLRKPAEQLAEFKKCGKIQRKKFFEAIKTTETKLNGRINPETILLLTS